MTTPTLLVDDHLLLSVLLGRAPRQLRARGATLATSGLWYHRLCRALNDHAVVGSISRQLGQVDAAIASATVQAVIELPDEVELVSMRTIGWQMAELLSGGARLNLASLEALAAAEHLDATICLAPDGTNAPLLAAAAQRGVEVRTVG